MKRLLCITGLFLLGAIAGVLLGGYLVRHRFIRAEIGLAMLNKEEYSDNFAQIEFVRADSESAAEALRYAIGFHEQLEGTNTIRGGPEKARLLWRYMQLSVIEELAGNSSLAKNHMTRAKRILKEMGIKDSSEAHLNDILEKQRSLALLSRKGLR